MNFEKTLNTYMEQLNCSSKELSNESGISTAVISRFRNGLKEPKPRSEQLAKLSNGLAKLAKKKGIPLTKESISSSFLKTLDDNIDIEQLIINLNKIMDTFNISISDLSTGIDFSSSSISKIKTGQRIPARPKEFVDKVCKYLVDNFQTNEAKKAISTILNCTISDLSNNAQYQKKMSEWFSSTSTSSINHFLNNLDDFNLDDYIKAIHFDDIKVPHIPFYRARSSTYFGTEEMRKGELDFFKATILSKSKSSIFMCNDMPIEDMAKDLEFSKKWMLAIAISLKKGLHLDIIHNINRPFNEMILGLESWIPIYMTGQVSPYYLKNSNDTVYCHLNYVSDAVCLTGECIQGHHNDGKYILSTNSKDIEYSKRKANKLLDISSSLMEIYKIDKKHAFNDFILLDSKTNGTRRRILPTLPIHTISNDLLLKILERNKIPKETIKDILCSVKCEKDLMKSILQNNIFTDDIEELSQDEFNKSPQILFLANSFYDNKVFYTYEEYLEHLNLTKEYSKNTTNYNLQANSNHAFKNIQIYINEKKYVMISKNTSPTIHFIIRHPKLRASLENFIPPIVE